MSDFDLAVVFRGDQLNQYVSEMYVKCPQYFSGNFSANQYGLTSLDWAFPTCPIFLLPQGGAGGTDIAQNFNNPDQPTRPHDPLPSPAPWPAPAPVPAPGPYPQPTPTPAPASTPDNPCVVMNVDVMLLTLHFDGAPDAPLGVTNLSMDCYLKVVNNSLQVEVTNICCDPLPDDTNSMMVRHLILPQMGTYISQKLQDLTLPSFDLGVPITDFVLSGFSNHLILAANLSSKSAPATVVQNLWDQYGFGVLLSQDFLQASAANLHDNFDANGGDGVPGVNYSWNCGANLTQPQVSLNGNGLDIAFTINGNASASVTLIVTLGVGFDISSYPPVKAACTLKAVGNQIQLQVNDVQNLNLIVTPSGGEVSQIAGWIIDGIIQGVVDGLTPQIKSYMEGMSLSAISLPKISLFGLSASPEILSISGVGSNDYLRLSGNADVA